MSAHTHSEDPTGGHSWPLWTLALLALGTVVMVGWQRTQVQPVVAETDVRLVAPVTWERALHFEDRPDGSIAVLDSPARREVTRLQGEQGFARGALRTLAHARLRQGLGAEQPFVLTGYANARLTLSDPATGERINLESFGPSNVAVFARLRHAGLQAPTPESSESPKP